jgi:hypothetical protein
MHSHAGAVGTSKAFLSRSNPFVLVQRIRGMNGLVCEVFFVHGGAKEPEARYAPSFWFERRAWKPETRRSAPTKSRVFRDCRGETVFSPFKLMPENQKVGTRKICSSRFYDFSLRKFLSIFIRRFASIQAFRNEVGNEKKSPKVQTKGLFFRDRHYFDCSKST